jgi:hypothetical protein
LANKRLKTEHPVTANPLSDSDSDSSMEIHKPPPKPIYVPLPVPKQKKKKKKSALHVSNDMVDNPAELERRDRRMQRFGEEARATPPRVDTPDYIRDSQIAASLVFYLTTELIRHLHYQTIDLS